jgi:hypothetical protein
MEDRLICSLIEIIVTINFVGDAGERGEILKGKTVHGPGIAQPPYFSREFKLPLRGMGGWVLLLFNLFINFPSIQNTL